MGALQPMHLFVILVVGLIVFGPGKLTEIGGQLGKAVREFRQLSEGATGVPSENCYCTQCGAAVSAGAAFCSTCGGALDRAERSCTS
jgi:TatA/E family protein of Tat protein translocase